MRRWPISTAEPPTDLAADGGIVQPAHSRGEQRTRLGDDHVVVEVSGVEQPPGDSGEQRGGRRDAARLGDVIGRPEPAQSGIAPHRQRLDAGILDEADQSELQRLQRSDLEAPAPQHEVRAGMGGGGAEQQPGRLAPYPAIGLGQPDQRPGNVGTPRRAGGAA